MAMGKKAGSMGALTCRQVLVDFLEDYVEGTLPPAVAAELDQHLRDCRACMAYLKTYRKTRELARQAARVEMPREMRDILRTVLRKQMSGENP